jgi:hypothetical protein
MRANARNALTLAAILLLAVVGCSPEAERVRSDGPGADIGNSSPPVLMHGDTTRNNPDFQTPKPGRAPADARGVPGWWVQHAP